MKKLIIILGLLFITVNGFADDLSRVHFFVDGEVLTAAYLNNEFDPIISTINDLTGENLSSDIAITTSGICAFNGTKTTFSGDVGIGNTAPSEALEVTGDVKITDATPHLEFEATGDDFEFYAYGSMFYLQNLTDGHEYLRIEDNHNITLRQATDVQGTLTATGATTLAGALTANGNVNLGNGADTLTINASSGITYTPAATWTFTGNQTVSGTWADLGSVTTCDINGGTITGITDLAIADGGTGSSSTAYCSLTTNVSGTLPIANGGTNATVAVTGLKNLGGMGMQLFTGSGTFTVPAGITTVYLTMIAGGGGGGSGDSGGGGGGSGEAIINFPHTVTPAAGLTVTIGAGGTAGTGGGNGGNGGDTVFNTITLDHGNGGTGGANGAGGAGGGTAGAETPAGGTGGVSQRFLGAAGGDGAGGSGVGGAGSRFANGGDGGTSVTAGTFGSGGGGSTTGNGSAGGAGFVLVQY